MKPKLYIETTIPSYLTARSVRDVVLLAHQQLTREWWETRRDDFEIFVSPVVIEEATRGDAEAAARRLALLDGLAVLAAAHEVEELARRYLEELRLPESAIRDAAHLAFACSYAMDYLLTWNCSHIANAMTRKRLERFNQGIGVPTPTICTPEELMEKEVEVS